MRTAPQTHTMTAADMASRAGLLPDTALPDAGLAPVTAPTAEAGTLAAAVDDLASRAEAAHAQRITDAQAKYRELVGRNGTPRDGDDAAMLDVMRTLGKSTADLRADLALIDQRRKLDVRLAQLTDKGDAEALTAKAAKLSAELHAIEAEQAALKDREQATRNESLSASQHARLIREHLADIARFEAAHADLFGVAS